MMASKTIELCEVSLPITAHQLRPLLSLLALPRDPGPEIKRPCVPRFVRVAIPVGRLALKVGMKLKRQPRMPSGNQIVIDDLRLSDLFTWPHVALHASGGPLIQVFGI